MKERLNEIIEKKQLTATKFADMIHVNPSAISHLLKGRNKPGYDVLVNIANAFPDISMDWLLTGRGQMLNRAEGVRQGVLPLYDVPETASHLIDGNVPPMNDNLRTSTQQSEKTADGTGNITPATSGTGDNGTRVASPPKTGIKLIMLFGDGSFREYHREDESD